MSEVDAKDKEPRDGSAYTTALCWESCDAELYNSVPEGARFLLERFARIVAYKTAHNLRNRFVMDQDADPLTYTECGGLDASD